MLLVAVPTVGCNRRATDPAVEARAGCDSSDPACASQRPPRKPGPPHSGAVEKALNCDNAVPIVSDGQDTGYERCAERVIHRKAIRVCPDRAPRQQDCKVDGHVGGRCLRDSECGGPHAYCGWSRNHMDSSCSCMNGCVTDVECGPGQVCLCEGANGRCVPADCRSDADCDNGAKCFASPRHAYLGTADVGIFACQTVEDTCSTDEDCVRDERRNSWLCVLGDGKRSCQRVAGIVGRPLLLAGKPRVAMLWAKQGVVAGVWT